ncbi:VCBS repeat-containing protein [Gangjinia marincola]|uniref:VCBS repeat-containing protein n=1 Tax=Gangjinia marincola TaxID=578463 RepID=A0ABN1MI62_9FLAO
MKKIFNLFAIILLIGCTLSCSTKKSKDKAQSITLFELLSPKETGIDFFNEIKNQKDFNIFKYRNFYNGGGVALGDINNDGLVDIYMTANMNENKLYLNQGNFTFKDISKEAGVTGNKPWSTGVTMADVNADGLLDIYVSNAGNMKGDNHNNDLYINNGDLTFSEKAQEYNLAETGFSTHASFFDYDRDGDLDVYVLNNSNVPVQGLGFAHQREVRAQDWDIPKAFKGVGDMLLRNDNGYFTDVSEEAGIYGSLIGFGLGVMISDINQDLYPDIYVSNDFYERDYLYINNQDGTFTENITAQTAHLSLSAMGVDIADVNGDGLSDIFITDMLPEPEERVKSVMEFEGVKIFDIKREKDFFQQYIQNTLQINNGNQTFSETAYFSGVSATDWSWSGLLFDMDNDGHRDIYITNGINHDLTDLDFVDFFANDIIQKMALTGKKAAIDSIIEKMPSTPIPNYAYQNKGDLTFEDKAEAWGLGKPSFSNGAAYGDLDNDGDLDLVVNNVNMPSFIYRNNTDVLTKHHYLGLSFKGDSLNPFGIGTKVLAYAKDALFVQELVPSRGFQSSVDYTITLGLGEHAKLDSLRVIWPDASTQVLNDVSIDQRLTLHKKNAIDQYVVQKNIPTPLLSEIENADFLSHTENSYSDFDIEGLLHMKTSQEGPALAIGDLNQDGLDDIFMGAAEGQSAAIYLQKNNFSFKQLTTSGFEQNAFTEDVTATIEDLNNDGLNDLIIGTGSNNVNQQQHDAILLYQNKGNNRFEIKPLPIIKNSTNISSIQAIDYDNDGDQDLMVFSRSLVGIYGISPNHYLLENTGNFTFKNVTKEKADVLKNSGMVTATTKLSKNRFVVVEEWGTPKQYVFENNQLKLEKTNLSDLYGFWNAVHAVDIDQDGDQDLVLGNQGRNLHYKPSKDDVMKLWINDFDGNGSIEQIMTLSQDGKDMPIHQKKELTGQLVSLKRKNLKASDYAKRSIQDLFPSTVLQKSIVKKVNFTSSIVVINNEDNSFEIIELPPRAQLSCINAISSRDINNDGFADLILGGNNHEFKPQYSRLDASLGEVLINREGKTFEWQSPTISGVSIKGEIQAIDQLKTKAGDTIFIFGINDQRPQLYQIN